MPTSIVRAGRMPWPAQISPNTLSCTFKLRKHLPLARKMAGCMQCLRCMYAYGPAKMLSTVTRFINQYEYKLNKLGKFSTFNQSLGSVLKSQYEHVAHNNLYCNSCVNLSHCSF